MLPIWRANHSKGGFPMKKLALFLALCMMLSVLLAGCSSTEQTPDTPDSSNPTETGGDSGQPDAAPRTDLNMSLGEAPGTFDPHYSSLIAESTLEKQMYEPLVRIVDDGKEMPLLATDYSVSDDGLVYTFNLRQDVRFHNGEELKASDVVFTFERAKQSPYLMSATEAIASVEAADDYTFVMTLSHPYGPIMQYLDSILIINEKHYNEVGNDDFSLNPCGTGPYTLKDFQQAVSISMEAFPDYWGGEAPIKTLNWKIITDTSTSLIAFEAGELDYVGVPSASWADMQQDDRYCTEATSGLSVVFMMMNTEIAPFDSKQVRQAVNYALNKEDICLMAMDGLGVPAYTLANPELVAGATTDCPTYSYDPEKAKELLAEAGYPDGLDAGALKTTAGPMEKVSQVIQSNLATAGITISLEIVELTTFSTDLSGGNYTLGITAATIGYDFSMYSIAYMSQSIGSFNFARYSNPEVDALFAQALSTADNTERNELYKSITNIVQEDAVYAPVLFPSGGVAYHKDLHYVSGRGHVFYEWSWQ